MGQARQGYPEGQLMLDRLLELGGVDGMSQLIGLSAYRTSKALAQLRTFGLC
jgi:hypothetical protein